jgi:hypothetical protein
MSRLFEAPDLKRLCAAVGFSCLLHLSVWMILGFDTYHGTVRNKNSNLVLTAQLDLTQSLVSSQIPTPASTALPSKTTTREQPEQSPQAPHTESFFTPKQLSKNPRPIGEIDLEVPQVSLLTTPGHLLLKLRINRMGQVENIEIEKNTLPQPFADAVADVFRKSRYEPGEIDGRPVGSILLIEITHENESVPSQ